MQDISFDLETLGLKQDAMILAIGAVKFDRKTGEISEQFYQAVDITAPVGGGTIDASTVYWWMNQPAAARSAIFDDSEEAKAERVDLRQALVKFSEFIGFNDDLAEGEYPDVALWQRGDKDGQWLASAYQGMGLALPFRYWQLKDERTLTELFKPIKPMRFGVHHNALDDAIYQAQCLCNVFARLYSVQAFVAEGPVERHYPAGATHTDGLGTYYILAEPGKEDGTALMWANGNWETTECSGAWAARLTRV